jgi:hypothetical protein
MAKIVFPTMRDVTITVHIPLHVTMRLWFGMLVVRIGVAIAGMQYQEHNGMESQHFCAVCGKVIPEIDLWFTSSQPEALPIHQACYEAWAAR